jgi:hypothetical protein
MPYYLGQRYVAGADQGYALERALELRRAVEATSGFVRLLSTTYVANEEWVFDVFQAESAEQVRDVYGLGDVAFERVIEAIHLTETSLQQPTIQPE